MHNIEGLGSDYQVSFGLRRGSSSRREIAKVNLSGCSGLFHVVPVIAEAAKLIHAKGDVRLRAPM